VSARARGLTGLTVEVHTHELRSETFVTLKNHRAAVPAGIAVIGNLEKVGKNYQ
jgi:hypothetical protein